MDLRKYTTAHPCSRRTAARISCSRNHGRKKLDEYIYMHILSVVKCLWVVFVWGSCRARVCAGVGGVVSVGVSCVRVTCWLLYIYIYIYRYIHIHIYISMCIYIDRDWWMHIYNICVYIRVPCSRRTAARIFCNREQARAYVHTYYTYTYTHTHTHIYIYIYNDG